MKLWISPSRRVMGQDTGASGSSWVTMGLTCHTRREDLNPAGMGIPQEGFKQVRNIRSAFKDKG